MAQIEVDPFGDKIKLFKWDWRDKRIMDWINNFPKVAKKNTFDNMERQNIVRTGRLKRSLAFKTFAVSGGDGQVFSARYLYYEKFIELAVTKKFRYTSPVPPIPGKNWKPITVPDRPVKGRPFVVTEMRRQAARFESMARGEFSFVGSVFMIYAAPPTNETTAAINRALFWSTRLQRYNRQ